MKQTFLVKHDNPRKLDVARRACEFIQSQVANGQELSIVVGEVTRTLAQNAKLWAMLTDISNQVGWKRARWRGDRCLADGRYVNLIEDPKAATLDQEEFKDVLTAALRRPRMLGGIDGGVVAVGLRTSKMTKREMKDLIELMNAFGAEHDVEWSEVAKEPW